MSKTSEWIIVCFFLLSFAALVGAFGGIIAGDILALKVALTLSIIVATIALLKARKANL